MFFYFLLLWNAIARVRRRGEIGSTLNLKCIYLSIWQIWGDKKFLSFINETWNRSRYLVFWSLGTITGLRDRVWGLIALRKGISTSNTPYLR